MSTYQIVVVLHQRVVWGLLVLLVLVHLVPLGHLVQMQELNSLKFKTIQEKNHD